MSAPKQVIVVRKDLNMRKGKIAAQVAHASMKVLLQCMDVLRDEPVDLGDPEAGRMDMWVMNLDHSDLQLQALKQWLDGQFTKICVSVDSEQELLNIYKQAQMDGVLCSLIQDAGKTEFGGVPTYTCVAIGPDFPEKIDILTGKLKLL